MIRDSQYCAHCGKEVIDGCVCPCERRRYMKERWEKEHVELKNISHGDLEE